MTVIQLIAAAFRLAASRYPELHKTWIAMSLRVGSLLPNSLLLSAFQRIGELDMVLRCMEDDFSPPQAGTEESELFSVHYQAMFSELWIGAVYEIVRLLIERKLVASSDALRALAQDLTLLRITLEKHEIAKDRKLAKPLAFQKRPPNNNEADDYLYSKNDPQRAHIMPAGVSSRGSAMWLVTDVESERSYWLERRALSERIVDLWAPRTSRTASTP